MAVTVRTPTAALRAATAAVREVVNGLGKTWAVRFAYDPSPRRPYPTLRPRKGPAPTQIDNSTLGLILQHKRRDFYKVTPTLRAALQTEIVARFYGSGKALPNAPALMMAVAAKYKAAVVERMLHQGQPDLNLPENSAKWTSYKARLGLSTQKGRASGQLVAATQRARAEIQRMR